MSNQVTVFLSSFGVWVLIHIVSFRKLEPLCFYWPLGPNLSLTFWDVSHEFHSFLGLLLLLLGESCFFSQIHIFYLVRIHSYENSPWSNNHPINDQLKYFHIPDLGRSKCLWRTLGLGSIIGEAWGQKGREPYTFSVLDLTKCIVEFFRYETDFSLVDRPICTLI